jgi:Predicted aminopeptidase
MHPLPRSLRLSVIVVPVLGLLGCMTVGYYAQAIKGHMDLMNRRKPITQLLQRPELTPELHSKLAQVLRIRDFAGRELHLPDNQSYRNYADLKRSYVVWNVFAAPEFSVELFPSCFLVLGCMDYRGYFEQDDAQHYAQQLRQRRYDVYVSGVTAYSTLGWFDDPVLNTMIDQSEAEIARLIFHELAHQQLYVRSDSTFNESFAVTVEWEGLWRWLKSTGNLAATEAGRAQHERETHFIRLVLKIRERLRGLYQSPLNEVEKRAAKARIFDKMRIEYQGLKEQWGGWNGYDFWFSHDLNNAKLAAVFTYGQYVPAFRVLLAEHGGDLPAFYRAAAQIGRLPPEARATRMKALGVWAGMIEQEGVKMP